MDITIKVLLTALFISACLTVLTKFFYYDDLPESLSRLIVIALLSSLTIAAVSVVLIIWGF